MTNEEMRLVAMGRGDAAVFSVPSRAAGAISGTSHCEIAGAGHLWPDEEPEAFVKMASEWLG